MLAALDTTAWLAAYAALVATGGLAWQVYSWRAQHATRIVVKGTYGFLTMSDGTLSEHMAMVEVYNRSPHPIEIRSVGWVLDAEHDTSMPIIDRPLGASIPGQVAPRSNAQSWLPLRGLQLSLREHGNPKGTKLRAYTTDGEGRRHLAKSTIEV
jgi:hypothetical protein